MTEVPVTDWANYEGELPERYPHRQPRKSGRGTEPIHGPDRAAYGKEKKRRLKARSPTLTVTKVESSKQPTMNTITFDNGMKAGHAKSKNAKVGDKFVVASQDGMFPFIMDAEGNTPYHLANTMDASQQEDTDELKARASSPIIADYIQNLAEWGFNNQDHTLLWDSMCLVIEADERGEFEEHIDMLEGNYESEEGNAPIQDPMEFGEMANWTPLDGSEGLKRKRAEAIQVESVAAEEDIRMIYVRTREAAEEEAEKFIRHNFPADMKYAYQINATDEPNRWEMLYERIPQGMESIYSAESPSATIPVNYPKHLQPDWQKTPASDKQIAREMRQAIETGNSADMMALQDKYGDYWNDKGFKKAYKKEMEGSEPSWVKPVATALGFTLGFLGIHEIKKVL